MKQTPSPTKAPTKPTPIKLIPIKPIPLKSTKVKNLPTKDLPWKTCTFSDNSGSWLEAYIPHLKWTYVVEEESTKNYRCSLFINNHCSEPAPLHAKPLKSLRNAKEACLNHFRSIATQFQAALNSPLNKKVSL
jgi:hypothetical protein